MPEFLVVLLEDEAAHASLPPREMAALIDGRGRFLEALRRAGRLRDAALLRASREGKRVRRGDGALRVEDGPFVEAGLEVGGTLWIDAPGLEEAARLAGPCPALATDALEVRPLMKCGIEAGKESRPGKLFAFLVLGRAASEEAWVGIMDRIDAETKGRFPADAFLGGGRLHPPGAGRRLEPRGERRATLDGPFLEAREVVGGLFFMRLASLEDAVRWAGASPFVDHGALEIRELWRT